MRHHTLPPTLDLSKVPTLHQVVRPQDYASGLGLLQR
jgi:hypothetical protein